MGDPLWFFLVVTSIKLLLIPAYRSTDFDVHRHWIALTSSFPLSQWYLDESSQWTLDYPPLFAYFQLLLSIPSRLFDLSLVYLRLSVAVSDLALLAGVALISGRVAAPRRRLALALILWSPALLIVDHIHFQYNGYLLGLLLISLAFVAEGRDLAGGIVFAVLICSKHLFMVAAPVYFVYLLRHYCRGGLARGLARFVAMGAAVAVVFAVAFGPFVYHGQMKQVFQRLFPFGRGLCHAYWAPNFWVFYIILDKGLAVILPKLGFSVPIPKASFTGGLVGDSSAFAVLPQVTPMITFLLVLLSMSPCLFRAFIKPQPKHIIRWVAYAYTCGFMFGWHVHEKASLHFVIPLGITAMNSLDDTRHYFLLSIVSCYSMFPLLFEPQEYPIKLLLLITHATLMWAGFSSIFSNNKSTKGAKMIDPKDSDKGTGFLVWFDICYLLGLIGVELWGQFLHPYIFGGKLPFLPLMLVSMYCAVGMLYSWAWQLTRILTCD